MYRNVYCVILYILHDLCKKLSIMRPFLKVLLRQGRKQCHARPHQNDLKITPRENLGFSDVQ